MQNIIKSWLKSFIFVGFFGLCVNLIYLALPVYMMVIYDKVLFSFSRATLFTLVVGVLISLLVMGLIDYFRSRLQGLVGNDLSQQMIPFVFKSMQDDATKSHHPIYARGLLDLELLRDALVRGYFFNVLDLPWVVIYLWVLYFIHPLVGVVGLSGVLMTMVFQTLLRKIETKRYTLADIASHESADFVAACLRSAQLVAGLGMRPALMEKYRARYEKILVTRSGAEAFQSAAGAVIRMLQTTVVAAVFTAGAFVFFEDEITMGAICASVVIIARLFYPFERNLADMKASIEAMAAYKRLKQYVNTQESTSKLSLPAPQGRIAAESITQKLGSRIILNNISFTLEPGETLGIFGPSACGKTCLCKVLIGIWPAGSGKVRLDGAELGQWPEDELGTFLGYMPQEPSLFAGSVADNIARLGAVDSGKIIAAAKKAGIHEMILKLPQGYETKIDQTGKNLAAGQRQLISLARAVYGDPKFVVLDEPHTYLDEPGLRMLFTALKNLKEEKVTTIVVSDRPNLIMNMDKLLLIKEGQVAMYGPGKEVLSKLTSSKQSQQAAGV